MRKVMLTAVAFVVSTAANADFADDVRKIWIDDQARFYLRACDKNPDSTLRELLDKYGSLVFRKGDESDEASDWNTRYRWEEERPADDTGCANIRNILLNTIYAPAIKP